MIDDIDALFVELLDAETVQRWGSFHSHVAYYYLGLQNGKRDEARIASAREAKAKGIPLWRWAQDYAP